jgi:hypothetical protein
MIPLLLLEALIYMPIYFLALVARVLTNKQ